MPLTKCIIKADVDHDRKVTLTATGHFQRLTSDGGVINYKARFYQGAPGARTLLKTIKGRCDEPVAYLIFWQSYCFSPDGQGKYHAEIELELGVEQQRSVVIAVNPAQPGTVTKPDAG